MRPRLPLTVPVFSHQGGWDEIILFFGAPVTLFILLRWLGLRKERREEREQSSSLDHRDEAP